MKCSKYISCQWVEILVAEKYKTECVYDSGLAGKSEVEQARADMIVHCIEDTYTPIFKFKFESDEARKVQACASLFSSSPVSSNN